MTGYSRAANTEPFKIVILWQKIVIFTIQAFTIRNLIRNVDCNQIHVKKLTFSSLKREFGTIQALQNGYLT